MIELKDKDGNILAVVPETIFPLRMPISTTFGDKEYKIRLNYKRDRETKQLTNKIKSVNMVVE